MTCTGDSVRVERSLNMVLLHVSRVDVCHRVARVVGLVFGTCVDSAKGGRSHDHSTAEPEHAHLALSLSRSVRHVEGLRVSGVDVEESGWQAEARRTIVGGLEMRERPRIYSCVQHRG